MPPSKPPDPYRQMAALMLAQGWDRGRMTAALKVACDFDEASVDTLVRNVMADWQQPYPPAEGQLAESFWQLIGDAPPGSEDGDGLRPELPHILAPHTATEPIPALSGAAVPKIDTRLELADWLDVTPAHLDWFADCAGRLARQGPDHLRHYNEMWLRKRSGGKRLVEAPLPKLKRLQRKIQDELLAHLPVHLAAYGFVRGRDCRGHAALHAGEDVVLTVDLKDFFASVQAGRVHAIFRCLGYPAAVARLLTGLVTTQTPPEVLATLPSRERAEWRSSHLPQGAPTSPALANLSAHALDCRLSALARCLGARYSRYADDLAFSGDRGLVFDGAAPVFELVSEIVRDSGFRVNSCKTRIMRQGRRQRVTGIVINQHLNVPRPDYDRLKAILTNCVRHGPSTQNRMDQPDFRAHLTGRVGWIASLNPGRGRKLYALLDRIDWHT